MWVLVFIYLYDEIPYVEKYGQYRFMTECFQAREKLGLELSGKHGYFPIGQQAVCIKK
tara:strand:+ start:6618 stop:6791 length:174 start_codon:yes stop_codon:yes gene_type:complete